MTPKLTKWVFASVMAVVMLVAFSHVTEAAPSAGPTPQLAAQSGPVNVPTIIRFTSDPTTTTVDEAESGEATITLNWVTIGLQPAHRLELSYWRLHGFQPMVDEAGQPLTLPNSGEFEVQLVHTLEFEPPAYRLAIWDATGMLDQWVITIPYDVTAPEGETEDAGEGATPTPTDGAPEIPAVEIELFAPVQPTVDIAALSAGGVIPVGDNSFPVEVTWNVNHRLPESNLVFEQLLEDGGVVQIETARPNLWVPSDGTGLVKPLIPSADGSVTLRVRVVDLIGGGTLAEAETQVNVTGTGNRPVASATPLPTTRPAATNTPVAGANAPTITLAEVRPTPIGRGEQLEIRWAATNANTVALYQLTFDRKTGNWSRYSTTPYASALPATGTAIYPVPLDERQPVRFEVEAVGLDGQQLTTAQTTIADIRCEQSYFIAELGAEDGYCGFMWVDTQAAYQEFEHGFMIWLQDRDLIIVLFSGSRPGWVSYPDTYVEGDPVDAGTPPSEDLIAPRRGFGELWIANPEIREGLGWATSMEESYSAHYQFFHARQDAMFDKIHLNLLGTAIAQLNAPALGAAFPASGPAWSLFQP